MGINLGSMKGRKEEEEDVEVFLPVGLPTACRWRIITGLSLARMGFGLSSSHLCTILFSH